MSIDQLETPVLVVDLERMERNFVRMQAYCDRHGLRLRPHVKTHKLPHLARRRIELGAAGITCQKLGEAEVMADAGLEGILISYPLIGPAKSLRLAARAAQSPIGVLIEFDSGNRRTGVTSVDAALHLAQSAQAAGLRFDGLMTYLSGPATAAFVAIAKVSGGGTPGAWRQHEIADVTEVRVGTYIYHDRATVAAGAAALEDCALEVHATVVSRPARDRAVIDAGSKTLSSDLAPAEAGPGCGLLLDYPEAVIERLSEEHGMIGLSACREQPALGERVRILPNHVCPVSNLHDAAVASRNGALADVWPVAARGRTV